MKEKKNILKKAFLATVPVLTGYLVLGFGFGIIIKSSGFSAWLAVIMSLFVYAGSMQYAAIGLLTGSASLITVALTTLAVNARHLFYGISMLDKYKNTGAAKPYLIFALTDETYSLVCTDSLPVTQEEQKGYYLLVSILNHCYWITGSILGALAGSLLKFNSAGIDFALTALFVTVFVEQWLTAKNHTPALIGVAASVGCLLIFGADKFLIPAMLVIGLILCLLKEEKSDD